jgi:PAS domain S-box-containing protein
MQQGADVNARLNLSAIDPVKIANVMLEGIWVCDRDAMTAFVNPRMAEILLTNSEAMVGTLLFDHFHPDDQATVRSKWRERMRGQSDAYETRLIRSDGTVAYTRIHVSPITVDGVVHGSIAMVSDNTVLHQAAAEREEALRSAEDANAATMRLLGWVSHELRTPLNTISGFAQLLQNSLASDADKAMAANIVAASTHVNALVQDLLDYARAEANALEPTLSTVDLSEVVAEAVSLVTSLAAEHRVTIRFDRCESLVVADRRRLVQVLTNLVSNAVKYGGNGNTVTVQCQQADRHVRCMVTDQGTGIPAHLQREIFRPFHRLANSHGTAGAGLGLSICEAYTRAMNGTLSVQSEVGRGTTFTVVLPDAAVPAVPAADMPMPPAANSTVLYVEDEPLNAALVTSIIGLLPGRQLEVAATVAEGIDAVRRLKPALCLLDLNLPDGTGFDVLSVVRSEPQLAHTQVFMLSADATEQSKSRASELGADRFITKPFDLTEFLALLEAATSR